MNSDISFLKYVFIYLFGGYISNSENNLQELDLSISLVTRFQGLISSCQAWKQVSLPTEPSYQLHIIKL